MEKHFPAPDRRKFFDIFGLGGGNSNSFNDDSNPPTPGTKRKKGIRINIKDKKTGILKIYIVISGSKMRKRLIRITIKFLKSGTPKTSTVMVQQT